MELCSRSCTENRRHDIALDKPIRMPRGLRLASYLEFLFGVACTSCPRSAVFTDRRRTELELIDARLCLTDVHELVLNALCMRQESNERGDRSHTGRRMGQ